MYFLKNVNFHPIIQHNQILDNIILSYTIQDFAWYITKCCAVLQFYHSLYTMIPYPFMHAKRALMLILVSSLFVKLFSFLIKTCYKKVSFIVEFFYVGCFKLSILSSIPIFFYYLRSYVPIKRMWQLSCEMVTKTSFSVWFFVAWVVQ